MSMPTTKTLIHVAFASDRLGLAKQKRIDAQREYEEALTALRAICPHTLVAECDYRPQGYLFEASPPRRICETCGTEEEGWGSGYKILTCDRIRRVSRDQLYSLRR